jgi:hypothetical protein
MQEDNKQIENELTSAYAESEKLSENLNKIIRGKQIFLSFLSSFISLSLFSILLFNSEFCVFCSLKSCLISSTLLSLDLIF